jgi:hypothetical protein
MQVPIPKFVDLGLKQLENASMPHLYRTDQAPAEAAAALRERVEKVMMVVEVVVPVAVFMALYCGQRDAPFAFHSRETRKRTNAPKITAHSSQ